MTAAEAKALGYEVVAASNCEVGLMKNGKGIRTWWNSRFGNALPELDDPQIQKAIEINEAHENRKPGRAGPPA